MFLSTRESAEWLATPELVSNTRQVLLKNLSFPFLVEVLLVCSFWIRSTASRPRSRTAFVSQSAAQVSVLLWTLLFVIVSSSCKSYRHASSGFVCSQNELLCITVEVVVCAGFSSRVVGRVSCFTSSATWLQQCWFPGVRDRLSSWFYRSPDNLKICHEVPGLLSES